MVRFTQFEYPPQLYNTEVVRHADNLYEYKHEILSTLINSINLNRPNLELYSQQPYLTFAIRTKLIDFLLKMSIRLKILPFVFFRAVKIFDRYCSKRVVLLDQSQLIITTCLWIASKVQGGNNHFVNLSNIGKLTDIKTITDLGYGSGGRFLGPTERFRLPKLHELVKLCGAKCKYDQGMFKQMELHVLSTLEWSLNDPSIEEFLVHSNEFNINPMKHRDDNTAAEIFKTKEYLSYISLYSNELIDCDVIDLSRAICSLTNEALNLSEGDCYYQRVNYNNMDGDDFFIEGAGAAPPLPIKHSPSKLTAAVVKQHLVKAVQNSSEFILKLFESAGPQQVFNTVAFKNSPRPHVATAAPTGEYLQHPRHQFAAHTPSSPLRHTASSPLRGGAQHAHAHAFGISSNSSHHAYSNPSPTSLIPQPPIRKRPITAITPSTSSSSSISIGTFSSISSTSSTGMVSASTYKKALPNQPGAGINNVSSNSTSGKSSIPAPHQLPNSFNAFPTLNESMYEPVVLPSVLLKFNNGAGVNGAASNLHDLTPQNSKFPTIMTATHHAHNNSQASLHSQCSSRNDHGSIFEYESTNSNACNVGTPLSEDDSPSLPMIKIN